VLESVLELLYPTRCAGCDMPGALLCERCLKRLQPIDPQHACPRCGAPGGAARCRECGGAAFSFGAARCACTLEPPLSRAIVVHKDGGERRLARVLAAELAGTLGEWLEWPDAVAGVPATPAALARRGFDHGRALAAALADLAGRPHADLLACGARRDQRGLGREERAANVAAALRVREGVEVPSRVLLVDDVLTTGATLDAAAGTLLAAGAREVRVAAVARACGS
jgi:predicted amidophosphoribosyltransferase